MTTYEIHQNILSRIDLLHAERAINSDLMHDCSISEFDRIFQINHTLANETRALLKASDLLLEVLYGDQK